MANLGNAWNAAYLSGNCAWNTGAPSPELKLRLNELKIGPSRILDIGCGTGANAIFLAQQGHSVTAIDFAEEAIRQARNQNQRNETDVQFVVADFLDFHHGEGSFDLVLDSGCYHSCRLSSVARYMAALHRILKPTGVCISLIGNADDGELWGPARVTAPELVTEHDPFFLIRDLRRCYFDSTIASMKPLGWSLVAERRPHPKGIAIASSSALLSGPTGASEYPFSQLPLVERVGSLLQRISFGNACPWQIDMKVCSTEEANCLNLLIRYAASDRETGSESAIHYERNKAFRANLSDSEIIQIVITNLVVVATHEILESVLLDGILIYDPHTLGRFMDSRYAELITIRPA